MADKTYEYARLDAFPELIAQANSLIEEAFAYQKPFKFSIDFAPLAGARHTHERHVLIDPTGPRVVAHIGTRVRNFVWQGEVIPVAMLGGIAVSPAERGQGLFQLLFDRVLATLHSQCALFVLWSDKHEMYNKWHFYLAGKQWCYRTNRAVVHPEARSLKSLDPAERQQMAQQYRRHVNQHYFSPLRDDSDWDDLAEITSSELYCLKNGYAFRGKGMDLQGIIHDFAHQGGVNGILSELGNAGVIWSAQNEAVDDHVLQDLQQVGLWRPNNHPMALRKLSHLLGLELHFRDECFVVEKETGIVKLTAEELVDELFNYGKYGLRKDSVPMYIGGLDSV